MARRSGAVAQNVYLVSKVYPHNATRNGAVEACERSLMRLKTEYLDLYLLHWRGSVPEAMRMTDGLGACIVFDPSRGLESKHRLGRWRITVYFSSVTIWNERTARQDRRHGIPGI